VDTLARRRSAARALRAARRIAIVGGSGAGKSTLARELGRVLALPVIHLDAEHWRPGWIEPPRDEWEARHAAVIARERWIIDGNFGSQQPARFARADCVVFLDFSRWLMTARVLQRIATTWGRVRADMAPGCPEHVDLAFLRYVWSFPTVHAPRVRARLARQPQLDAITLRGPRDVRRMIAALAAS
jgi:adenylate kinase family enzyme